MSKSNKIGILTFSHISNKNYGALLQTFALKEVVKNLGYDVQVINYKKKLNIAFINRLKYFIKNPLIKRKIEEAPFQEFSDTFISERTGKVQGKTLSRLNSQFDTFIVGSDQVWRYNYTKNDGFTYFLDFPSADKKLISYAASFGTDHWEAQSNEVTSSIKTLLRRFNAISVREESGVKICSDTFEIDSQCVLDPTMLLDSDYYDKIIKRSARTTKKEHIAQMLLNQTPVAKSILGEVEKKLSKETVSLNGYSSRLMHRYNGFGDWLKLIRDADFVVTDSFHCVVFSILYRKQFVCVANKRRGITRIENLLKKVGIENRIIFKPSECLDVLDQELIDYTKVLTKMNILIDKSRSFLVNSISSI